MKLSSTLLTTTMASASAQMFRPSEIRFGPGSEVCEPGKSQQEVCVELPRGSTAAKVDIFFLFDDTGSFARRVPQVASIANSLVTDLQSALPSVDFGFGVGRFEDYGGPGTGFSHEYVNGRPFTLNQPIVTTADAGSPANLVVLLEDSLERSAPGYGGDAPESAIAEGLYQIATGAGFDGNGDGDTTGVDGSQVAGSIDAQVSPDGSGDVPAFSTLDSSVKVSGTVGGVGFRSDALKIVILATDICSIAAFSGPSIPSSITGAFSTEETEDFACRSVRPGTSRFGFVSDSLTEDDNTVAGAVVPKGAHTLPEAIEALNAAGIRVLGMGPGAGPAAQGSGPMMGPNAFLSAIARITGAVDSLGTPLVFDLSSALAPLKTAIINSISTSVSVPIDIELVPNCPFQVTVSAPVLDVSPGGTACFDVTFVGNDPDLIDQCSLTLADLNVGTPLGVVPVFVNCFCDTHPLFIDFSSDGNGKELDHGDYVGDLGAGVTVSVNPFLGGKGPDARIYDTSRIVDSIDPEEEDPDLDCTNDGNALIIQEENASGLPDDSANGGIIIFSFDVPFNIFAVKLLDTERKRPRIKLFKAGGIVKQRVQPTGECGKAFHPVKVREVNEMSIKLPESGAISQIVVCPSPRK